jgi:hypothetical protein
MSGMVLVLLRRLHDGGHVPQLRLAQHCPEPVLSERPVARLQVAIAVAPQFTGRVIGM